jgi:hypothetical protein
MGCWKTLEQLVWTRKTTKKIDRNWVWCHDTKEVFLCKCIIEELQPKYMHDLLLEFQSDKFKGCQFRLRPPVLLSRLGRLSHLACKWGFPLVHVNNMPAVYVQYGSTTLKIPTILERRRLEDLLKMVLQILYRRQQERQMVPLLWLRLLRRVQGVRDQWRAVQVWKFFLLQVRAGVTQALLMWFYQMLEDQEFSWEWKYYLDHG